MIPLIDLDKAAINNTYAVMPNYTIVPLKLDFAAEKGGMAVSAVWRLVYLLATHSHWNQGACQSTQAVRAVLLS